jgi:hypothetical protein
MSDNAHGVVGTASAVLDILSDTIKIIDKARVTADAQRKLPELLETTYEEQTKVGYRL